MNVLNHIVIVWTKFTELPSSSSSHLLPPIHGRERRGRGGGCAGEVRSGWPAAGAATQGTGAAAGEGRTGVGRGSTVGTAGHRRRHRGGGIGAPWEGKRRGRDATAGEGEERVRDALHGRENEETKKP
jgi:hypothetical protein